LNNFQEKRTDFMRWHVRKVKWHAWLLKTEPWSIRQ